jgi:hypothetical protein
MLKLSILAAFFILSFSSFPVRAATSLDVVINEIAWMGSPVSSYDEWIEVYNDTGDIISLDGWKIKAADGTLEIYLNGDLPGKSFYLLERTDDNSVPDKEADLIYKGALKNEGETLALYDNSDNLMDSVNCHAGWFAGNNETKQTMERKTSEFPGDSPDNWGNSQGPEGTPKVGNSIIGQLPEAKEKENHSPELPEQKPESVLFSSGVILNEILPSPEGLTMKKNGLRSKIKIILRLTFPAGKLVIQ